MNSRQLLDFFRQPEGRFFLALFLFILLLAFIWFFYGSRPLHAKADEFATVIHQGRAGIEDLVSDVPRFTPPPARATPPPPPAEVQPAAAPPEPIPIGIGKTVLPAVNLSTLSAPFGRLIKCKLVITVDSSVIDTPIIGLVTEDVYNSHGDLIVPAGTEVHGTAQTDRVRERIGSNEHWVLVFNTPDEEELTVQGMALDEDVSPDGQTWGLTDGSAGLRGTVIKSDKFAELKIFAATFLAAGIQGFESTGVDQFAGIETYQNTPRNATLQATAAVVNQYAQSILDTVKRDGFFVRVPAGKQFYLYVTQPIDRTQAQPGDSLFHPAPVPASTVNHSRP